MLRGVGRGGEGEFGIGDEVRHAGGCGCERRELVFEAWVPVHVAFGDEGCDHVFFNKPDRIVSGAKGICVGWCG